MATGPTTTGVLAEAMPSIIAKARIVNEHAGTWQRTCDMQDLGSGNGLNWQEFAFAQIAGQAIDETTENNNDQQLRGTLLSSEPTMVQVIIKVTDRAKDKMAAVVKGQMGPLTGNAIRRIKDEDYIALFATFATTASPGTGQPLSHGHIAAAVANATSNVNEPHLAEVFTVLHGFQVYDLQVEALAPIGTYAIPSGMTEEIFRNGFRGKVAGSNVFTDDNINPSGVSANNGRGATHSRKGVVAVNGMGMKSENDRDLRFGGGADVSSIRDEYSFVERSTGNWCYQHVSDCTAPTA